jgi:glucuronoarabinoxylan endo-1,4-beta-xylanase
MHESDSFLVMQDTRRSTIVIGVGRSHFDPGEGTMKMHGMRAMGIACAIGCVTAADAVTVDVGMTYQTIDGFGFFGPRIVWWGSSNASAFYSDAWLATVVDTLGTTLWRNEYYSEEARQDANWAKQTPAVQALHNKAVASGNPLKFIYSVWSPPSAMKVACTNGCWGDPTTTPYADGIKNGGCLATSQHTALANWLVQGIQNYQNLGINLYAISFQNEPLFCQFYNSGFYSYGYYAAVLAAIGPVVKATFPNIKFFGAEHMLAANMNDGRSQFQWIYESQIGRNSSSNQHMDIWAYHGYSDGVNPIPGSEMAQLWSLVRDSLARYGSKPIWMTETSGYDDTWGAGGAQELAAAIFAALQYGNLAGWVYWYGAEDLINTSDQLTKRGYVQKHFSRYLRPGAVRVATGATGNADVHVVAFKHDQLNNFVVLAMNSSSSAYTLSLTGANVPSSFTHYRTTATDNCANAGTVQSSSITLPANSLNTLVSGPVHESGTPVVERSRVVRPGVAATTATRMYSLDGKLLNASRAAGAGRCYVEARKTGNVRLVPVIGE